MANKSDMKISFDLRDFNKRWSLFRKRLSATEASAVFIAMNEGGQDMRDHAKNNRRWTDRTGDARRQLTGGAFVANREISAFVGHGVWYGVYLELSHQRKYAILEEARNRYVNETLNLVRDIVVKT